MRFFAKRELLALALLLGANLVVPRVLSAACCKYCGSGDFVMETTRPDNSCTFYCTIEQCSSHVDSSTNCAGGSFSCSDNYIDNCDSYVDCS